MNICFQVISSESILEILPLLEKLNTKTPKKILKKRVLEMATYPNYECIGLYVNTTLVGICGLWYTTRHYIGKSAEPDHVIIDSSYRGNGLGAQFFNWINQYISQKGCQAIELNTYVSNQKSHKFYINQGYNIYGFHMLKILREDQTFY